MPRVDKKVFESFESLSFYRKFDLGKCRQLILFYEYFDKVSFDQNIDCLGLLKSKFKTDFIYANFILIWYNFYVFILSIFEKFPCKDIPPILISNYLACKFFPRFWVAHSDPMLTHLSLFHSLLSQIVHFPTIAPNWLKCYSWFSGINIYMI